MMQCYMPQTRTDISQEHDAKAIPSFEIQTEVILFSWPCRVPKIDTDIH